MKFLSLIGHGFHPASTIFVFQDSLDSPFRANQPALQKKFYTISVLGWPEAALFRHTTVPPKHLSHCQSIIEMSMAQSLA